MRLGDSDHKGKFSTGLAGEFAQSDQSVSGGGGHLSWSAYWRIFQFMAPSFRRGKGTVAFDKRRLAALEIACVAISRVGTVANNPFLADVPHRHYLREWRKERGLTQKQLAKKIDMDETVICRFESGARGISLEIMLELFKALDVTPGQFFSPPGTPDLNLMCERMTAKQRRRVVNYAKMILDGDEDD